MKETLEEAIKPKVIQRIISSTDAQTASKEILELFNKWQSERMYELMEEYSFYCLMCSAEKTLKIPLSPKYWFSQFKKGQ